MKFGAIGLEGRGGQCGGVFFSARPSTSTYVHESLADCMQRWSCGHLDWFGKSVERVRMYCKVDCRRGCSLLWRIL
jgi:hypothetical protein